MYAAGQLADLLAERGDLDEASVCAPGPTPATVRRLAAGRPAGRARRPGRAARPGRRRRQCRRLASWPTCWPSARRPGRGCAPGPTPATSTPPGGWPTCWPSAATWTELRARADAGDGDAAVQLAVLLAERGDLDGLRARADAGDGYAAAAAGRPAGRARRPGRGRAVLRACADRRRRGRRAAGRAADAAGPGGRSGAIAPVRPEPGRVNCLCVK